MVTDFGQHPSITKIKRSVRHEPEALSYIEELEALVRYYEKRANSWRGIAAEMGYEPKAHLNVRPTSPWLLERIAKFRAETPAPLSHTGRAPGKRLSSA